jgi:preprotein translocase subunit SecY
MELQWRGIAVVILIITDVIFFAVVFVYLDNNEIAIANNAARLQPWLLCLAKYNGDKNQCLDLAASLVVNEATVMAVLLLLSVSIFETIFHPEFRN